jgi:hypothetical protein
MAIEIKRMWEGGPLRQWSAERPLKGKWIAYATGGFAGCYVCEWCQESADGVYFVREPQKWLCGACKRALGKHRNAKAAD